MANKRCINGKPVIKNSLKHEKMQYSQFPEPMRTVRRDHSIEKASRYQTVRDVVTREQEEYESLATATATQ